MGAVWTTIIESLLTSTFRHIRFLLSLIQKVQAVKTLTLTWLQDELQAFEQANANISYSAADVQATLTELTAISASTQINMFISDSKNSSVYVCGGGALNDYLMKRLQAHLPALHRTNHCTFRACANVGRSCCICMVSQTNTNG